MFGMGWTELLLIGIVALIVVGPKDLPVLFRNMGQFVGKARGMAREFSRAMEDAADQSGMKDATDALRGLSNPKKFGLDKVKDAADFTKWEPGSNTAKLAEDRAEAAKKIHAASAEKATKRREAEAAAQADKTAQDAAKAAAKATGPGASQADATPDAGAAAPQADTAGDSKA
ncbi:Sec-independent protein translocase protein TatB [Pseudooceanicola nitratireducens]|uniref:Sec-independent protein translocase protein TatB n=1 Tax=Pseudooceanicola nitratireducens TaxID=517719 RepID=UPI003C7D392E